MENKTHAILLRRVFLVLKNWKGMNFQKNTFTNKKPQVKNYLKNRSYFREKIGSQKELDDIINLTDNEIEKEKDQKRQKANNDSGKNNESI